MGELNSKKDSGGKGNAKVPVEDRGWEGRGEAGKKVQVGTNCTAVLHCTGSVLILDLLKSSKKITFDCSKKSFVGIC